jgi:hypothetical protein
MSLQDKSGESTWSLNGKVVENDLVKTFTSWSWEEIKGIWIPYMIKRLMSYSKCRSVEEINNPARLGSNNTEWTI